MYLSGPNTANLGDTIRVSATGLPENTRSVDFSAGVHFGSVSGTNSAEWSCVAEFTGALTIKAKAKNDFGQELGSASQTVSVTDPSYDSAPLSAPGDIGLRYQPNVPVGTFMQMSAENIASAHSLTLEFYRANGGIFRYFPRGRQTMPLVFKMRAAGETEFYLTARDAKLRTFAILGGVMNVLPEQVHNTALTSGQTLCAAPHDTFAAPLAMNAQGKPPMAVTDQDTAPEQASQSDATERMKGWFMGPTQGEEGETITVTIEGGSDAAYAEISASNATVSPSRVDLSNSGAASFAMTLNLMGQAQADAQIRTAAHELIHNVQHNVSVAKKSVDSFRSAAATDVGQDIQDRLEARLTKRFDKS